MSQCFSVDNKIDSRRDRQRNEDQSEREEPGTSFRKQLIRAQSADSQRQD